MAAANQIFQPNTKPFSWQRKALVLTGAAMAGLVFVILGFVLPGATLEHSHLARYNDDPREVAILNNDLMAHPFAGLALGYEVSRVSNTGAAYPDQCLPTDGPGFVVTSRTWWFIENVKTVSCGDREVWRL